MLTDTRHASLAVLAAFVALLLLGVACTSSAPTTEELAAASLLTLDDLPGEGWIATDITEDDLSGAASEAASRQPEECKDRTTLDPFGAFEQVAAAGVVVGRSFQREPDQPAAGESFGISVTAFDSEQELDALLAANAADPLAVQRAADACSDAIGAQTGYTFVRHEEPPTLSIADAEGLRNVATVTDDNGFEFRIVNETHWFVRGRVMATFTIGESTGSTDYQSLLEAFEQRVVSAQQ